MYFSTKLQKNHYFTEKVDCLRSLTRSFLSVCTIFETKSRRYFRSGIKIKSSFYFVFQIPVYDLGKSMEMMEQMDYFVE